VNHRRLHVLLIEGTQRGPRGEELTARSAKVYEYQIDGTIGTEPIWSSHPSYLVDDRSEALLQIMVDFALAIDDGRVEGL